MEYPYVFLKQVNKDILGQHVATWTGATSIGHSITCAQWMELMDDGIS